MWRLHRYYLKEVLVSTSITFLVLFAVVLVSCVYKGIQQAQGGGPFDALLIVVFFTLDSFQHLLTISFLLATVTTYSRAAMDRELLAIRAAGIAPRVPIAPALLVGIALTALGSFALHYVIPEVHWRKYNVMAEAVRRVFLSLRLDSDRIVLPGIDAVMTYGTQGAGDFRDCVLYSEKPVAGFASQILFADRIVLPRTREGDTHVTIWLQGVRDRSGEAHMGEVTVAIPIAELAGRERRTDRDDDLRSDQLLAEVFAGLHARPHEAVYTLFRRCCFSLMPALLAPIGYCLAELARDRGRVFALALALVPLSLFYLGEVLGARLLLSTHVPWCGWLPGLLLAAFGLPLCWRQLRR